MGTSLDCISCLARQALEAGRFVSEDPAIREPVMRNVLRDTAEIALAQPPVIATQEVHRHLRRLAGAAGPCRAEGAA